MPLNASFQLQPATITHATVNVETATYRILQQINGVYSHEVIARQFIRSLPTVPPTAIGTETLSYGNAPGIGCFDFAETKPVSSLRGFNEEIVSNLSWDMATAPRVTLDGWLPKAANGVTSVTSSQLYEKVVSWSIQGALSGGGNEAQGKNIGVSLGGNYGQMEKWSWSMGSSMAVADWQMVSPGPPASATTYDFFAANSPNTPNGLVSLKTFETPPATATDSQTPLSFATLNSLQRQGLEARNDSDWSTKSFGGILPAAKATLNATLTFNYGGVYNLYTLKEVGEFSPNLSGYYPYGALHTFTVDQPIQFDFSAAIMQPPLAATWTITANLDATATNGFFPVQGTVTLNQTSSTNTTLFLGANSNLRAILLLQRRV